MANWEERDASGWKKRDEARWEKWDEQGWGGIWGGSWGGRWGGSWGGSWDGSWGGSWGGSGEQGRSGSSSSMQGGSWGGSSMDRKGGKGSGKGGKGLGKDGKGSIVRASAALNKVGEDELERARAQLVLEIVAGPSPETAAPAWDGDGLADLTTSTEDTCDAATGGELVGITVATYNVLYPIYSVKHSQAEGIDAEGGSNWPQRVPAIAAMLREGDVDAYLLQEVGLKQMVDLRSIMGVGCTPPQFVEYRGVCGLRFDLGKYSCIHITHPGRAARDGTAVLVHSDRLMLLGCTAVPLPGQDGERDGPYMAAAVALVSDAAGCRVLVSSAHFYGKGWAENTFVESMRPPGLQKLEEELGYRVDAVIWGGDANHSYTADSVPEGFTFAGPSVRPTRGTRRIDWIFASQGCEMDRSAKTHKFVMTTHRIIRATGHQASDHRADAVVVRPPARWEDSSSAVVTKGGLRGRVVGVEEGGPQWRPPLPGHVRGRPIRALHWGGARDPQGSFSRFGGHGRSPPGRGRITCHT